LIALLIFWSFLIGYSFILNSFFLISVSICLWYSSMAPVSGLFLPVSSWFWGGSFIPAFSNIPLTNSLGSSLPSGAKNYKFFLTAFSSSLNPGSSLITIPLFDPISWILDAFIASLYLKSLYWFLSNTS
jgi:hypothetical protein